MPVNLFDAMSVLIRAGRFAAPFVVVIAVLFLAFSGIPFFQNQFVEVLVLIFAVLVGAASGVHAANEVFKSAKINPKKEIQVIGISILIAWGSGALVALTIRPLECGAISVWCLAFIALGSFVGFLFAIPRVLQNDGERKPAQGSESQSSPTTAAYRLMVNTNLEQISDWLTKIIIGLGLVNLKSVPHYLDSLGQQFSSGVPDAGAVGRLLGEATAVYFSITGFFGGYLITRLYLSGILNAIESGLSADLFANESQAVLTQSLDVTQLDSPIAPGAQVAAAKIVQVASDQLSSNLERGVWAKAQMIMKNYSAAVPILRDLVSKQPGHLQGHLDLAEALTLNKNYVDAYKEITTCLSLVTPSVDLSLLRKIYRDALYLALFQVPSKYEEAITMGEFYLLSPLNLPSASILINLACAYGQKYKALPKGDATLLDVEEKAYDALHRAIALEPRRVGFLRMMLDQNHPPPVDFDDLMVFSNIPRFRKLVDEEEE